MEEARKLKTRSTRDSPTHNFASLRTYRYTLPSSLVRRIACKTCVGNVLVFITLTFSTNKVFIYSYPLAESIPKLLNPRYTGIP